MYTIIIKYRNETETQVLKSLSLLDVDTLEQLIVKGVIGDIEWYEITPIRK